MLEAGLLEEKLIPVEREIGRNYSLKKEDRCAAVRNRSK